MQCFYINLDSEENRKSSLEENFSKFKKENWFLSRVSAKDAAFVNENNIQGKIRAAEKACYLSHVDAIQQSISCEKPVLILEDDALFGEHSCTIIENVLETLPEGEWDVLFCDIGPGSVQYMFELMQMRKHLSLNKETKIFSLKGVYFGCATSYIINPKSREKILALLTSNKNYDIPYDLVLRNHIFSGDWKGWFVFPFATSLSNESLKSQIQVKETSYVDFVLSFFRMSTWADRDLVACKQALSKRSAPEEDLEADIYGKILGTFLSEKFNGR